FKLLIFKSGFCFQFISNIDIIIIGGEQMKTYSPKEMADILNIQPSTLRRYSSTLEENGYRIERNNQNHRFYKEVDIVIFQHIITGTQENLTLEEATNQAIQIKDDTNHGTLRSSEELISYHDVAKIKDILYRQNELIKHLVDRLDKQEDYMKKRDKLLVTYMEDIAKNKKELPSSEKRRRGFWARLFKR